MTAFHAFLNALRNASDLDGVLGDGYVHYPPSEDVDYWATPRNAVVFGWMGVDGVHYAILKIDGQVRDSSPVVEIGPLDFDDPYSLLAPSFTDYLAIGCGATPTEIGVLIENEQAGQSSLLAFMRSQFQQERFWSDGVDRDIGPYTAMMIQKPDDQPSPAP